MHHNMRYLYVFPSLKCQCRSRSAHHLQVQQNPSEYKSKSSAFPGLFKLSSMKRLSGNTQLNTIANILKTRGKYISLDLYRTKDNFTRHNKKLDDLMYLHVWMEKVSLLFVRIPEQWSSQLWEQSLKDSLAFPDNCFKI